MRKLVFGACFILTLVVVALATQRTRTTAVDKVYNHSSPLLYKYKLVEYTWSIPGDAGTTTNADTLVIGPFNIGGTCHKDSAITLKMEFAETTIDSIHWQVLYQLSNDESPSVEVPNTTDWYSVELESTRFDSTAYRAGTPYIRMWDTFKPRRYSNAKWFRALVYSNGKTGTQTLGMKVVLPLDEPLK